MFPGEGRAFLQQTTKGTPHELPWKVTKPESFKTVMCKGWLETGGCSFGENCRFAHGEAELVSTNVPVKNPKYKTKLCKNYTENGLCPYGDRCLFIHPKAKTAADVSLNPYYNRPRREELLRERNLLSTNTNSRREQTSQNALVSKVTNLRIPSPPVDVLKEDSIDSAYFDYSSKLFSPLLCDTKDTPKDRDRNRLFVDILSSISNAYGLPTTLTGLSNDMRFDGNAGVQNMSNESTCWSTNVSEVFDFAIESDNQARCLAADLNP